MAIEVGIKDWRAGFVCDVCRKPITVAGSGTDGAGIVVYIPEKLPEFRIVHKLRCDPRFNGPKETEETFTCWMSLDDFLDELKNSLNTERSTVTAARRMNLAV
jgi:hypothetical protein